MIGLEEAKDTTEKKPIRNSETGEIKYYEETTTKGDYSKLASACLVCKVLQSVSRWATGRL